MSITVIITTYRQPRWLYLTLVGYAHQDDRDFQLVVADDGSGPATRSAIEKARAELGLTIEHLWQPDQGFRKCRILNKSILGAVGDYLVFSDGDCVPRRDFIATHRTLRKPGHFLSGGYVKLTSAVSDSVTEAVVASGDFCRRRWLIAQGYARLKNLSKLTARGPMAGFLNRFSLTRAGWHGHNASCWKRDAVAVNGFDERMGWGGEDREFGYRLMNAGVRPKRIRYSAICVHLHHERPWKDRDRLQDNDRLRARTLREGIKQTAHGLNLHEEPGMAGGRSRRYPGEYAA